MKKVFLVLVILFCFVSIVRAENDVTNRNRIFDRNNNNATVQNSGNSTVNVNVRVDNEED